MAMAGTGANFDIARVIQRTFGLVGRNFVPFYILAFVFAGLPALVLLTVQPTDPAAIQAAPGAYFTTLIIGVIVSVAAGVVLQGALTRAAVDDLSGKGVKLNEAVSAAFSMLLPLIGLGLLVALGVGIGLILLIVPGIFLMLCWAVASPVMVVERLGVTASMQRSMQLTQNHRWAIFGLGILYFVGYLILMTIVATIAGTSAMGMAAAQPPFAIMVVMTLIGVVASLVATVGAAAIYFELREIKEGVGATELAKVFS